LISLMDDETAAEVLRRQPHFHRELPIEENA
jgi:hypothetical protein